MLDGGLASVGAPSEGWRASRAPKAGSHPEARPATRSWALSRLVALAAALALAGCPGPPPTASPLVSPLVSIRLVRAGERRAEVVACVASITGWDPALAARLVDRAPVTLPGLAPTTARDGAAALEGLGAVALVVSASR